MEKSLVLSTAKSALPSFCAHGVTYNDIAKMFLTPAWVSQAGNAYQEGLRISDKIAVTYNIGHGYAHTFLNGIRIFRYEQGKTVLIGEKSFYDYWWSEDDVRRETVGLVAEYIMSQCRVLGHGVPDKRIVQQVASGFVDETITGTKLLAM